MILVKNKLRQPLIVNVPQEDAVHFLAKEQKEVSPEQFNAPEMQNYVNLEYIVVLRVE